MVQRQFWRLIATGITSAEAALKVGVSVPVGARWFRHAGGMTPLCLDAPSGRYLSFEEREEIALMHAKDKGVREIARELGRDPGTISRELRRNAATRSGKQEYRALVAQWKAQQAARRPKAAKLVTNGQLREYVQERLAGTVRRPDGSVNAMAEALNSVYKAEVIDRKTWSGLIEVMAETSKWVAWYHQQRLHSRNGYWPPVEVHDQRHASLAVA